MMRTTESDARAMKIDARKQINNIFTNGAPYIGLGANRVLLHGV